MSKKHLTEQSRRLVADRANHICEYCRVRQVDSFLQFEIDHIISQKHGGGSELENLAYACPHCNVHKSSDLTTFLEGYDDIVQTFNPRRESWEDHFSANNGEIIARTKVGAATVKLFQLNHPDRIIQRSMLQEAGCWPG